MNFLGFEMAAFLIYSQAKLSAVARRLNERSRKTLSYETPAERFNACVASIIEPTTKSSNFRLRFIPG